MTSDTFSSAWRAWHCQHVAKMLAGAVQNESWFWMSLFVASAGFGELGRRFERVERCRKSRFVKLSSFIILDIFGHD